MKSLTHFFIFCNGSPLPCYITFFVGHSMFEIMELHTSDAQSMSVKKQAPKGRKLSGQAVGVLATTAN